MAGRKLKADTGACCIYVIAGQPGPLVDNEVEKLVEHFLKPEQRACGLFKPDLREILPADVFDELRTLPFLGEKRVVLLKGADDFISENRQLLEDYFDEPSNSGVLIMTVESWPSNTKLAKKLSGCGELISIDEPKSWQLPERLSKYASEAYQKKLTRDAAAVLVELIGEQMGRLYSEIDKLALFVGDKQEISIEDIEALTGKGRLIDAFEVIDLSLAGKTAEAIVKFRDMLERDKSAEYKVVGAFAWYVRKMFEAKALLVKGVNAGEICSRLKIWKNKEAFFAQLKKVTLEQIGSLIEQLAQTDYAMKTGKTKAKVAMEQIILQLSGWSEASIR